MDLKHKRVPRTFGISGLMQAPDLYFKELMDEAVNKQIAPPVVINDLALENDPETVMNTIDRLIQNRIIDERINSSPICYTGCEHPITQRYNLGVRCPSCGFRVTENRLESEVVLRAPDEVGFFVNPRFWMVFNATFGCSQFDKFERKAVTSLERGADLMMWMISPHYVPNSPFSAQAQKFVRTLERLGYQRGLLYFAQNYRKVFEMITEPDNWRELYPSTGRRFMASERMRKAFIELVRGQGQEFFTRHLLLVPSKLITAEETRRGISVDPVFVGAVDAVKNLASLYAPGRSREARFVAGRAVKINRQLAYFHMDFRNELMGPKPGLYRAKCSATFTPHSGRATITPITEPHDAWKLKAPWRWSVNLLSIDIQSKLMHRGYTARQSARIVEKACMQYDPLVDEIFKELIRESPSGQGIMVSPLRNPTLVQLSIQTVWIDEIMTDVDICSVRIGVRIIKMSNADFDGDQLMFYRPVDANEMRMALDLRPDQGMMSANDAGVVAHGMVLHNEPISMHSRMLADAEPDMCPGIPVEEL